MGTLAREKRETFLGLPEVILILRKHCFVDPNESINYTTRVVVRLFVNLNKSRVEVREEWRVTNMFFSVNKKPKY